jgi:2-oxoglutarate dehydrogenase E1 component
MRDFRKPLVLMTPKSLLRHPLAKSSVAEMTGDTKFQPLIGEAELTVDPSAVRKVLYCSGKVYYDLLAYRRAENITDVAITRVEQIAPFPMLDAQADAKQYPNAELLWVQEEPKNMGSYFFTRHALKTSVSVDRPDLADIGYVGRASAASTSTGDARVHAREQAALVTEAFE